MSEKITTIFRVQKNNDHPYVMLDKRPLNQDDLSWKAKGIWAYLMSKPDDWTVIIEDIIKHAIDGERAVRSGLNELKDKGYMLKSQVRDTEGKFIQHIWLVFESPIDPNNPPYMGASILTKRTNGDDPFRRFPQVDNPQVDNAGLLINELTNTDSNQIIDDDRATTFGDLISMYESYSGMVTKGVLDELNGLVDEWDEHIGVLKDDHPDKEINGCQAVQAGMELMYGNINKYSFRYVQTTVRNWKQDGFMSKKPSKNGKDEEEPTLEETMKRRFYGN